jgi:hypothetical protein
MHPGRHRRSEVTGEVVDEGHRLVHRDVDGRMHRLSSSVMAPQVPTSHRPSPPTLSRQPLVDDPVPDHRPRIEVRRSRLRRPTIGMALNVVPPAATSPIPMSTEMRPCFAQ